MTSDNFNLITQDAFRRVAMSDTSAAITIARSDTGGYVIALRPAGDAAGQLILAADDLPNSARVFDDLGACAGLAAQLSPNRQVSFDLGSSHGHCIAPA